MEEQKKDSVVDTVFDAMTLKAAQALVVGKKSLAASARWLENRSKKLGELAEKLTEEEKKAA